MEEQDRQELEEQDGQRESDRIGDDENGEGALVVDLVDCLASLPAGVIGAIVFGAVYIAAVPAAFTSFGAFFIATPAIATGSLLLTVAIGTVAATGVASEAQGTEDTEDVLIELSSDVSWI